MQATKFLFYVVAIHDRCRDLGINAFKNDKGDVQKVMTDLVLLHKKWVRAPMYGKSVHTAHHPYIKGFSGATASHLPSVLVAPVRGQRLAQVSAAPTVHPVPEPAIQSIDARR